MTPHTWIRPSDPRVLEGRPLLDLGIGDGQTLRALVSAEGLVVGLDRSTDALRSAHGAARLVCGEATGLPFADDAFEVVVAGDLFHHLDDATLRTVLVEVGRVGRSLVAWWYALPGRGGLDAPKHPRSYDVVAEQTRGTGLDVEPLQLEVTLETPSTVGLRASRLR